jgi:hypothetical protein
MKQALREGKVKLYGPYSRNDRQNRLYVRFMGSTDDGSKVKHDIPISEQEWSNLCSIQSPIQKRGLFRSGQTTNVNRKTTGQNKNYELINFQSLLEYNEKLLQSLISGLKDIETKRDNSYLSILALFDAKVEENRKEIDDLRQEINTKIERQSEDQKLISSEIRAKLDAVEKRLPNTSYGYIPSFQGIEGSGPGGTITPLDIRQTIIIAEQQLVDSINELRKSAGRRPISHLDELEQPVKPSFEKMAEDLRMKGYKVFPPPTEEDVKKMLDEKFKKPIT